MIFDLKWKQVFVWAWERLNQCLQAVYVTDSLYESVINV